jgi:C4-dicarboxylate-specific signal transduction histidine kinase
MMEKDKKLISFTLFIGVFFLCILFLCLQFLRRRRSLRQDDSDDEAAAVLLEADISQLETNQQRSSSELQEEVKSLRETQAHVRSILQSLQIKLERKKDASSKALMNESRDKIE